MRQTFLVVLVVALSGCALTSRGAILHVRYFTPEALEPTETSRPIAQNAFALRLGRVIASSHLQSRIVYRDSNTELGEYETLRWTESPEAYVERSVSHALFDERGLRQGVGGSMPTLDVEVTAFEEVRRGMRHGGRVQLHYEVHDDQFVIASGTVTGEHEAVGDGIEQVVAAIAVAMHEASSLLASAIANHVGSLSQ